MSNLWGFLIGGLVGIAGSLIGVIGQYFSNKLQRETERKQNREDEARRALKEMYRNWTETYFDFLHLRHELATLEWRAEEKRKKAHHEPRDQTLSSGLPFETRHTYMNHEDLSERRMKCESEIREAQAKLYSLDAMIAAADGNRKRKDAFKGIHHLDYRKAATPEELVANAANEKAGQIKKVNTFCEEYLADDA